MKTSLAGYFVGACSVSCLQLFGCAGSLHPGGHAQPGEAAALFDTRPSTDDDKFDRAVSSLREQVQLLASAPTAVGGSTVHRAVSSLAAAVANVPDASGVDVKDAAGTIQSDYGSDIIGVSGVEGSRRFREALLVAAGAMALLAQGPYEKSPAVARRVYIFQRDAAAVRQDEALEAQPALAIRALAGAGAALSAIERAGGIVPSAVVRAPAPEAAEQEGTTGVAESQAPQLGPAARPFLTPFETAIATYSTAVDRLAVTPPDGVPVAVHDVLGALADLLEVVSTGLETKTADTLARMRSDISEEGASPPQSAAQAAFTRLALDRAQQILSVIAMQDLPNAPALRDEVAAMGRQVGAIDAKEALRAQVLRILAALEAADDAVRMVAPQP